MRGFTLIESLVALVVLSLILVASYRIFGSGLHGIADQEQDVQMAILAEGVLERVMLGEDLSTGTAGTYRWTVRKRDYDEPGFQRKLGAGSAFDVEPETVERRLEEVTVEVRNSQDRALVLRGLSIAVEDET